MPSGLGRAGKGPEKGTAGTLSMHRPRCLCKGQAPAAGPRAPRAGRHQHGCLRCRGAVPLLQRWVTSPPAPRPPWAPGSPVPCPTSSSGDEKAAENVTAFPGAWRRCAVEKGTALPASGAAPSSCWCPPRWSPHSSAPSQRNPSSQGAFLEQRSRSHCHGSPVGVSTPRRAPAPPPRCAAQSRPARQPRAAGWGRG